MPYENIAQANCAAPVRLSARPNDLASSRASLACRRQPVLGVRSRLRPRFSARTTVFTPIAAALLPSPAPAAYLITMMLSEGCRGRIPSYPSFRYSSRNSPTLVWPAVARDVARSMPGCDYFVYSPPVEVYHLEPPFPVIETLARLRDVAQAF